MLALLFLLEAFFLFFLLLELSFALFLSLFLGLGFFALLFLCAAFGQSLLLLQSLFALASGAAALLLAHHGRCCLVGCQVAGLDVVDVFLGDGTAVACAAFRGS